MSDSAGSGSQTYINPFRSEDSEGWTAFSGGSQTNRRTALKRFFQSGSTLLGASILLVLIVVALTAHVLFPFDPREMIGRPLIWPGKSAEFPLGTDNMGRDIAAGLAYGARVSLFVGGVASVVTLIIGIGIGAAAGHFGGWIEECLMRLVEMVDVIPGFLILVALMSFIPQSLTTTAILIGAISWAQTARLVRGEYRAQREMDYVTAARSIGFGGFHIAMREVLPNVLPSVIVMASIAAAQAILMEAALAFLGFTDSQSMSWGVMMSSGREFIRNAWYLALIPGLAIFFTVLALNILGDALNDALNPRARVR